MSQVHKCSKCGEEKPVEKFQHFNGKPSGQCRECKTAAMKAKRLKDGVKPRKMSRVEGDQKLCVGCDSMKPLTDFSPSKRGVGGVSAYCRSCFVAKFRAEPEKVQERTASYRKRHRERHLANHRVRMYEYRTNKKATSDGTVTDEFLKKLYATEYCHYCLQYTEEGKRTADHVVALDSGGAHSASNLVMACWTCNCTKRNLSEEEFMKKGLKL